MEYLAFLHGLWVQIDPHGRFILGWAVFLWLFWGLFVLVMGFYRAHLDGRLVGPTKVLAAPYVVAGWLLDFFTQWTIACLIFFDPPWRTTWGVRRIFGRDVKVPVRLRFELLVTDRLQRYVADGGDGMRYDLAVWVCTHLLDPFDPSGDHC